MLALAEGANVKQVGVNSPPTNQTTKQSKQKAKQRCSYCSGDHYSHECTKYKTVNSRKDRVMLLKLCYNCLTQGIRLKHAVALKLVVRADHIIILPYVSKLIQTVPMLQIRTLVTLTQLSVKENRINPQLAPVALTNVTLKHRHKCTLTNQLLRLTKQT